MLLLGDFLIFLSIKINFEFKSKKISHNFLPKTPFAPVIKIVLFSNNFY